MLLVSQLGNIVANLELVDTDINLVLFLVTHTYCMPTFTC